MTFNEWSAAHPDAARDLLAVMNSDPISENAAIGKSEAWAQQQARFAIARAGAYAWRNNVGATPAKCKKCGAKQQPVRYGLANDSEKLNKRIKSHDLIGAIPRLITPSDVGSTIAQFGSWECKPPGWKYSGNEHESAQAAWGARVLSIGGHAEFTTGDVRL